ncbi:6-phosphogluconate dehydrogenase NADP-binding [Trinorchestia longiramus]|nr:6-phosphogluconate dehydrogenase NADP-binding [Trinorchestia longiramus]
MGNSPCKTIKTVAMKRHEAAVADIALIGLAVMGQNLILNMNDNGWVVCAYNRTVQKVDQFLANEAKGTKVVGAHSLQEMVAKLKKPRRVMMLVKAGAAVDAFIEQLVPLLEAGDIIIDGGNSEYNDTQRRCETLEKKGLLFIGSGVSGGEEGARYGPSLMPGGHSAAWPHVKNIFQSICAKSEGEPCCDWVGDGGAGHFVKMVHNGIEYGDMQLICEAYHIMKTMLGMTPMQMSQVFDEWNKGELDSFLIEITANILKFKDEDASKLLAGPSSSQFTGDKKKFIESLRQALYASKIVSYAQGFMLLREAAQQFGWQLNYGGIALMWRGGCIIRSQFLGKIKDAFTKQPSLSNLLLDSFFLNAVKGAQTGWREVVAQSVLLGVPTPALSSALAFYDGYRTDKLPANLIQAQRDYFGAHTYELLASPGKFHHTNWTGTGGNVAASTYSA